MGLLHRFRNFLGKRADQAPEASSPAGASTKFGSDRVDPERTAGRTTTIETEFERLGEKPAPKPLTLRELTDEQMDIVAGGAASIV